MNKIRPFLISIAALGLFLNANQSAFAFRQNPASTTGQSTANTSGTKKAQRPKTRKAEANAQGAASSPTATPAPKGAPPSVTLKPAPRMPAKTAPSADVQAAHARGDVWVNTATKTFHKGGRWYGTTKSGKFMSERDALKAGYHPAKNDATE
jgi:cytoskeletal protein RodZ